MSFSKNYFIIIGCLPARSEIFKDFSSKVLTPTSLLGPIQDYENKAKPQGRLGVPLEALASVLLLPAWQDR